MSKDAKMAKNILIAADHRGYKLKEFIKANFNNSGDYELTDIGVFSEDNADYTKIVTLFAETFQKTSPSMGIIICGSGIGVNMAANRFKFIRAAAIYNEYTATMSRRHNNANVMCLASDLLTQEQALNYINIFIDTPFEGGRHQQRVEKLNTLGE